MSEASSTFENVEQFLLGVTNKKQMYFFFQRHIQQNTARLNGRKNGEKIFKPVTSKSKHLYILLLSEKAKPSRGLKKLEMFLMLIFLWNPTSPSEYLGHVILPRFIPA